MNNALGGFSYVVPGGWVVADAAAELWSGPAEQGDRAVAERAAGHHRQRHQRAAGRLDLKLFAGAEQDNGKAAVRLASDMGEFFMPFPAPASTSRTAPCRPVTCRAPSSYEVKFADTTKPNGQIWARVRRPDATERAARPAQPAVVRGGLGTAKDPVDPNAAKTLAQSIRPYAAPPPPAPDPNAPAAPEFVPGGRVPVGVPVPVGDAGAGMAPQPAG